MANYVFSVDGAETGTIGYKEFAFVYHLDFFDTTDTVTAPLSSGTLAFEIDGVIDLDLTGYTGITGFSTVTARSATGGVHLDIGQDFYDANSAHTVVGRSDVNGTVVLDASGLTRGAVRLEAQSDGNNVLIGGAGNDVLTSRAGSDQFDGRDGFDTVDYSHSSAGVRVDLPAGVGAGGDAQGDTYIGVERVIGSAFADRLVVGAVHEIVDGGAGNDVLISADGAYDGSNILSGGAGNDVVIPGTSINRCWGGPGIDQLNLQNDPDGARVDLIDNEPTAFGPPFEGFENLYGSAKNDGFYGDAGGNILEGAGGDDGLYGRGGSDVLRGGSGADYLDVQSRHLVERIESEAFGL